MPFVLVICFISLSDLCLLGSVSICSLNILKEIQSPKFHQRLSLKTETHTKCFIKSALLAKIFFIAFKILSNRRCALIMRTLKFSNHTTQSYENRWKYQVSILKESSRFCFFSSHFPDYSPASPCQIIPRDFQASVAVVLTCTAVRETSHSRCEVRDSTGLMGTPPLQ